MKTKIISIAAGSQSARQRSAGSKVERQDSGMVLPGENPAELDRLAALWEEEFRPCGPAESELLQAVVRAQWLHRRYRRMEMAFIDARIAEHGTSSAVGEVWVKYGAALNRIAHRSEAASRELGCAVEALQTVRQKRRGGRRVTPPAAS